MTRVGFIGLGVMGSPMSSHLSKKGFNTFVYNRTQDVSKKWADSNKGEVKRSPQDLAKSVNFLIMCVGNDDDVREILFSEDGAYPSLKPGTIVIDHTTTSAKLAKELSAKLKNKNCYYLDAPVSGGQLGAEEGNLTIMVGGEKEAYEKSLDVLAAYSKHSKYMGESGAGQLTKMVNQIAIAGLLQSLSEAVNFSEKSGLNSEDVLNVISKGAAQSWQMDNRWQTMLKDEFDFGFAVDWMRKDLDIVSDEASRIGANIHVTELVNNFYKQIQEDGGGRLDTSSLARRIKKLS
jgi:3-hydroxyisobutyrate dehydrogenase-like beta-hydroxyacid dehydrogenase